MYQISAWYDNEQRPFQVRIHNIRSGRPEPEIEILYAVYQDEKVQIICSFFMFMFIFILIPSTKIKRSTQLLRDIKLSIISSKNKTAKI